MMPQFSHCWINKEVDLQERCYSLVFEIITSSCDKGYSLFFLLYSLNKLVAYFTAAAIYILFCDILY